MRKQTSGPWGFHRVFAAGIAAAVVLAFFGGRHLFPVQAGAGDKAAEVVVFFQPVPW